MDTKTFERICYLIKLLSLHEFYFVFEKFNQNTINDLCINLYCDIILIHSCSIKYIDGEQNISLHVDYMI